MEDKKLTTPVHEYSSSVFLTPPLTNEAKKTSTGDMISQKFPLIQNLFLSPLSPEVKAEEEPDIVTSFYLQGYPLILEKIFGYLSNTDIKNCAAVSSRWRLFCMNLKPIASRLPAIAKERPPLKQKDKENSTVVKRTVKKPQPSGRYPLLIQNRNTNAGQKVTLPLVIQSQFKQTKCPSCSSPAKQYNLNRADCSHCSYSFCPSCLGKAHATTCCRNRSPTKRDHTQVGIGTKQSKKRLRRL